MEKLENILSPEQISFAMNAAKEIADKILNVFVSKKESLSKEIQELRDKAKSLNEERASISDWTLRQEISEKYLQINKDIVLKENEYANVENQVKAISNGGSLVDFEDKIGNTYKNVPDFRKVKTDYILFDEETILADPIPNYIPLINEKSFEQRGTVLDSIRITTDCYVVSYSSFEFGEASEHPQVFMLTLDQLVLTNLYYLTRLKAVYRKEAERKTESAKQYYFNLPLERRERHYAQPRFYSSISKALQKKYSEQEWNALPLSEKEELHPAYKVYGSQRIKSKLGENQMYASFHDMYNIFVNPNALKFTRDKKTGVITEIPIGKNAYGQYGNREVFDYWYEFSEMMNYKFKDISFQREELSENYKTAVETSFGESNTKDNLLADFGVLVKRQNGDEIDFSEIEQIKSGISKVFSVFGNLKDEFVKNNIKISHTGKKLVFARKAVGLYISNMGTIAVSDKYGNLEFDSTLSHEVAHFIDNKIGEKNGRRYETDNYESQAGIIAFTFRNKMNKPKSEQTDYINATKECFARALEQYFVMNQYGDDAEIIFHHNTVSVLERVSNQEMYVQKDVFNSEIKPLIESFLRDNESFFLLSEKDIEKESKNLSNEKNDIEEAIEALEILSLTLKGKDKKEVNEAIEVLKMLNENN